MTNEELKKKIADVLRGNIEYELHYFPDDNYTEVEFDYGKFADTLIAANIGDVSWWERKCKLCEEDWFLQKKQIEHYAESYKEMLQEDLDKYKHRAEVAERKYMIALNKYAKCDRKLNHYNKMTTTYDKVITKQAVKEFAEKLRDKEFSVKIGSEWCAVVKSRDIDEFVKEGGVRVMKQIDGEYLVKLLAATIRKFAAEDSDYPNRKAIRANERAIQRWLDKITDNADEQRQILDVIERGNWNMKDTTFKQIFDELRALGYEIVEDRK